MRGITHYPKEHWLPLTLIGFLVTASVGLNTVAPILLGGLVDQMGWADNMVGWLLACNTLGIGVGGIVVALTIHRFGMLKLARIGILLLVGVEILVAYTTNLYVLLPLRFVAGFVGGITYASALSAFAGLANPARGFSIYIVAYCILSALLLFGFPALLVLVPVKVGFFILAAIAFLGFLTTPLLRNYQQETPEKEFSIGFLLSKPVALTTVIAYLCLQAGTTATWSYLERMGQESLFDTQFIGLVLGSAGLFGILGAYIAIPASKKNWLIPYLVVGVLGIMLTLSVVFYFRISWVYAAAIMVFALFWSFTMPFYQAIQAKLDTQGRLVSIGAFLNMIGQSFGPASSSFLIGEGTSFYYAIWISIALLLLSLILILPSARAVS